MLYDSFSDASDPSYDPRTTRHAPELIQSDNVPLVAGRAAREKKLCLKTFYAVWEASVAHGYFSEQDFEKKFGAKLLTTIQSSKSNPNPAQHRDVLLYISSLPTGKATGKKHPWRHSDYVPPAAKPEPQPL